ncbi:hypothetical protein OIU84_022884 [Salix udensis]|uniref:Serine/threonine-protein phosphatase n=1 Tax=Salix udensis TaxID=889485 RepID=A0AAD6PFR2_9ROSI|nr:hypothetical protein OIU84_022884 [Salix udensis]
MDLELKRVQEARRNDCKKVMNYINSVDFTSLDDKEIRTMVMIRELGNGIVNRQTKLATEDDVSRVLKISIETMVGECRRIVDQISLTSFHDFNAQERKSLTKISEIARGIIAKGYTMNRHRDINQVLEGEDKLAVGMIGYGEMDFEFGDKEELAIGEISVLQDKQSMQDKNEVGVGQHNDLQDREITMLDKEGLVIGDQSDLHDGQSLLEDIEGVIIGEQSDLLNRETVMGDKDGLVVGERNDLQDRLIAMGDEEGLGARDLQDIEIIMEDKEGLVGGEHSDMQDKHVDMELGEPTQDPISWPQNGEITLEWIVNLMETFKWASWNKSLSEFASIMPHFVVEELITKASHILCQEPNCVKIQCDNNTEVVVVGDLRGQYLDLLGIWESVGLPSDKQLFVFNGNYIDRGKSSLELFLVLLAWKVFLPHRIYLLRGNHESSEISEICGFLKEVNRKFPEHGQTVYRKCLEVFAELPLASIIADCVYTTHGGLFRSEGITSSQSFGEKEIQDDQGNKSGRKKQKITTTLCLGSLDELHQVSRFVQDLSAKDAILTDVLWSDPTTESGLTENNRGDAGLLWGPDCTEAFLEHSKLKVIIRSHEGPDSIACQKGLKNMLEGYSTDHEVESGKLHTLFSAPDYPQHTSKDYKSKGAYAILKPPNFDTPEFVSFEARKRHEAEIKTISFAQQSDSAATSSGADIAFRASGISSSPSWIISLADDVGTPAQISEASKVEGSPLPSDLQEPHKSNYEYLLNLIGSLKKEIKKKDDELDDYKRKYIFQSPSPAK